MFTFQRISYDSSESHGITPSSDLCASHLTHTNTHNLTKESARVENSENAYWPCATIDLYPENTNELGIRIVAEDASDRDI
jgi:hypothetical protein